MRVLWISAAIIVVDQITKVLVKGISIPSLGIDHLGMLYGSSIPLLGDFFRLTYIENPGMAFGIDLGGKVYLTLFSLVAAGGILWYLYKIRTGNLAVRIALAMIIGGAIGNFIDRAFYGVLYGDAPFLYGNVVDFFDFDFIDVSFLGLSMTRFAVFNVADACVSIGVGLLLLFHHKVAETSSEPSAEPERNMAAPAPADSVRDQSS